MGKRKAVLRWNVLMTCILGSILLLSCISHNPATCRHPKLPKEIVKVEVYGATWCPSCESEVKFFEDHKIKYMVYWIDKDDNKNAELKKIAEELGIEQVFIPFTVYTDTTGKRYYSMGFDPDDPNYANLVAR